MSFLHTQYPKFFFLKLLYGNTLFIGVGIDEGLVHVFQVILDLIVGGADDGLEAQAADQFDAAGHLFRIHLGKGLVQYHQADGGILAGSHLGTDLIGLGKAGQKGDILGILALAAGVFAEHPA